MYLIKYWFWWNNYFTCIIRSICIVDNRNCFFPISFDVIIFIVVVLYLFLVSQIVFFCTRNPLKFCLVHSLCFLCKFLLIHYLWLSLIVCFVFIFNKVNSYWLQNKCILNIWLPLKIFHEVKYTICAINLGSWELLQIESWTTMLERRLA